MVSSRERTYGIMIVGIDPEREAAVSTLKKIIRRGSYLSENDPNGALMGEVLAKNLRVDIGDEVTVLGQGRDGSIAATLLTVRGIYASGLPEFDRSSIQITLSDFQYLYSMRGAVHEIVVVATSLRDVAGIKSAVQEGIRTLDESGSLVVLDWIELVPGLLQSIQMDLISGLIFYLILIMVVAFGIMNTFLMAVFERTKEFGVLMAIGTTPGRLTRILLIESTGLTMIGVMAGIALGSAITLYFQKHGIDFSGSSELLAQFGISGRMYPRLSPLSATIGPVLVLLITFPTALFPAWRIRRLRPAEALRDAGK
jgi:ABC-type lipoprotein release transport system permease subunit